MSAAVIYSLHRLLNISRLVIALILIGCAPARAMAHTVEDLVMGQAFVADPTGTLSLNEAMNAPQTPFSGIFTKGYTASVYWLKVDIRKPEDQDTVIFRLRPAYFDSIILYDPDTPEAPSRLAGDRHNWGQDSYKSLNHNFTVHVTTPVKTVWFRAETTSALTLSIEAFRFDDIQYSDFIYEFYNAVFIGINLCFLIWAAILFLTTKDRLNGLFFIVQLTSLLWSVSMFGYYRFFFHDYFAPYVFDRANNILSTSMVFSGVIFHYGFLRQAGGRPRLMQILALSLLVYPAQFMLQYYNYNRESLFLNQIAALFSIQLIFIIALTSRSEASKINIPKKIILYIYSILWLGVTLTVLPMLGLIKAGGLSFYIFIIHGLFNGILMLIGLQWRSNLIVARQRQAEIDLAIAERELDIHLSRIEEQNQFMAMLTHELRTPLTVLRITISSDMLTSERRALANAAIEDIDSIIERCIRTTRLERDVEIVSNAPTNLEDELKTVQHRYNQHHRIIIEGQIGVPIMTDRKLLGVILSNLVDNAIKYGSTSDPVSLIIARQQHECHNGIVIIVENSPGSGGWPEKNRLFSKFYRGSHAHEVIGSGLGLYIVAGLARLLHGHIQYCPTSRHIRFALWLPLKAATDMPATHAPSSTH